jgi:hypothetical protein
MVNNNRPPTDGLVLPASSAMKTESDIAIVAIRRCFRLNLDFAISQTVHAGLINLNEFHPNCQDVKKGYLCCEAHILWYIYSRKLSSEWKRDSFVVSQFHNKVVQIYANSLRLTPLYLRNLEGETHVRRMGNDGVQRAQIQYAMPSCAHEMSILLA